MNITTVADIAGRISQSKHQADRITAAALCLPSGALNHIRRKIPKALPKWRDASDHDVGIAVDIVISESLGVGVYSVEKIAPAWDDFWSQACDIRTQTLGKISFLKAAYQVKCLMFAQSTTLACGTAIKTGNVVQSSKQQKILSTSETLILDNEIDGEDNIEVFMGIWERMNTKQSLIKSIGIERNFIDVKMKTEQQERLLLLADYVAGIAHAFTSQANVLAASKVSLTRVKYEQQRLMRMTQYHLLNRPFDLSFSNILGIDSASFGLK
jgi:hypothetical protein